MTTDEIQQIVDRAYPLIQKYYGKGSKPIPPIELHFDIYARLSGIKDMEGEESDTSEAQYDPDTNMMYIYTRNIKNEKVIISIISFAWTTNTSTI